MGGTPREGGKERVCFVDFAKERLKEPQKILLEKKKGFRAIRKGLNAVGRNFQYFKQVLKKGCERKR